MTNIQDLSTITLSLKAQSGLGTPASGTGAVEIDVLPSQGLQAQISSIESAMIQRSRMRKRPRHGMKSVTAAYETELTAAGFQTGKGLAVIAEGVLGGTWDPETALDESDLTSLTISGTGVTLTFGGGDLLALGFKAGKFFKLSSMATSANNGVWVPIVSVSGSVVTVPSGYLTDETIDSTFGLTIAASLMTATPYTDRYFTVEENQTEIGKAKIGTDMRFNALSLAIEPNAYTKVGGGLGGRDLAMDDAVFTSPSTFEGDSLIQLEGGVFVNNVKRTDLSGATFGLQAPVSGVAVIGTRVSPDTFLGQFALTGQFTGVIADDTDFAAFTAEDDVSVILHCKEKDSQAGVGFYLGHMSYAGYSSPAGGEGAAIQTIPLYGGADTRGTGYEPTSMLISALT